MKTSSNIIYAFLAPCAFALSLPPSLQAVNPAPDGGYAGGNTAEGQNALFSLTTGRYNTATGFFSLDNNTTGNFNTAIGTGTLFANGADQNTATGAAALLNNTSGTGNTGTGAFALFNTTTGTYNNAFGSAALYNNVTGASNTAIGDAAGYYITGTYNICIGANVYGSPEENNTIRVGDNLPTAPAQSACYIGGIFGQSVDPGSATPVYAESNGKLGILLSSRRFKQNIKPMDKASEALLALKPITFQYKNDAKHTLCFGLIAEQVAEVDPDLVVRNNKDDFLTVRYDAVNAMLLNEFLKEHKKVEAQQRKIERQGTTIAELKNAIETITVHSKQQDSEIQKVRSQMQMATPGAQLAMTPDRPEGARVKTPVYSE